MYRHVITKCISKKTDLLFEILYLFASYSKAIAQIFDWHDNIGDGVTDRGKVDPISRFDSFFFAYQRTITKMIQ